MSQTISKTIEYLNSVTGNDYSDKFPATVNALTQLIKMGYGLPDFKKVIDKHTHLERKKLRVDIDAFGYNKELSVTDDHKLFVYS